MKKKYLIVPIVLFFFSCNNKDLVIQKAKKNCACSHIIEQAHLQESYKYEKEHPTYYNAFRSFNCDPPYFYEQTKNHEIFAKTNTLELKNNSKTKVYQVLIQINDNGKIQYQQYKIEPTDVLELGCDSKFNISFNYGYNQKPIERLKLSNLSKDKIEYKIHKVEFISEY